MASFQAESLDAQGDVGGRDGDRLEDGAFLSYTGDGAASDLNEW